MKIRELQEHGWSTDKQDWCATACFQNLQMSLCNLMSSYVPVRSPYILYNSLQLFTFSNFPRFFRWFRRCCRNKHLGCAPAFDCDNDLETWVRLTACCGLWWTVRNWDQKKLDYLLLHWMNWNESLLSGDKLEPHQEEMVSNSWMGSSISVAHLRHRAAQVLEHSAERLLASFYMRGLERI